MESQQGERSHKDKLSRVLMASRSTQTFPSSTARQATMWSCSAAASEAFGASVFMVDWLPQLTCPV